MDSMELNKGMAAVLIAGIAFFMTGFIGANIVRVEPLHHTAIEIKGAADDHGGGKDAAPAALTPIAPLLAKADPAMGESTAKKLCASCHTFAEGGKAGVGPNLYGVLGQPHGAAAGFNYSAGLKGKSGPWTYEALNAWLNKPSAYAQGTRMAFAGIKSDQQRADVIVYLRSLAKSPEPLPAP